jgi:hypothetical protein
MNDLLRYFNENTGGLIHKWQHYFDIYDSHFSRFRDSAINLLEFGVSHGGSLQMWKHYFGKNSKIYGVDINPQCKNLEEDQITIFIGDQSDKHFVSSLTKEFPLIDIVIDDGGHTMKQQINTFEILFPHVTPQGLYVCEDLHTSYRPNFGGGYRRKGTFVEYSKNFIDYLNAWHSRQPQKLAVSEFTKTVHSVHFYDSMLVIEKKPVNQPLHLKTGTARVTSFKVPIQLSVGERLTNWWLKKTSHQ